MSAMLSALGGVKPAWETQQLPATPRKDGLPDHLFEDPGAATRPYHVGRARARGQLSRAFETQNESAQLRRLQQALDSPVTQYEDGGRRAVQEASAQVVTLSHRLHANTSVEQPWDPREMFESTPRRSQKHAAATKASSSSTKPLASTMGGSSPKTGGHAPPQAAAVEEVPAPQVEEGLPAKQESNRHDSTAGFGEDDEELERAAIKIQAVVRGKQDRQSVIQMVHEEHAATKIQAIYRGQTSRKKTYEAIAAAEEGYQDYGEGDEEEGEAFGDEEGYGEEDN